MGNTAAQIARNAFNTLVVEAAHVTVPGEAATWLCTCRVNGTVIPVEPTFGADPTLITGATPSNWPARALAFLVPRLAFPNQQPLELWVRLYGSLVVDTNMRAIAADFVGGNLPTGDIRANVADPPVCIPGGQFASWLTVRPIVT
ncbi:MAG: hypothetical protein WKG01_09995 [Kofleriaceae bacterium]